MIHMLICVINGSFQFQILELILISIIKCSAFKYILEVVYLLIEGLDCFNYSENRMTSTSDEKSIKISLKRSN